MGNPVVEYVDCYHDLANAIILQAVKDYKNALFRLDDNPNSRDARYAPVLLDTGGYDSAACAQGIRSL